MKKLTIGAFLILLLRTFICVAAPANISFFAVDLKYNSVDGVKYCEIQQGTISTFKGDTFLNDGVGVTQREFLQLFAQLPFQEKYVASTISDQELTDRFAESMWRYHSTYKKFIKDETLKNFENLPLYDTSKLSDYHGIILTKKLSKTDLQRIKESYPTLLILDEYSYSHWNDKLKVSRLFDRNEELKKYRPRWGLYPKGTGSDIVAKINSEIDSARYVIKPRSSVCGNGVIIVDRENLAKTLHYIFKEKKKVMKDPDPAYYYWALENSSHFMVEQYIHSDVVHVPHLGGKPFDSPIRVGVIAYRDQDKVSVHICGGFWKVPRKSINDSGTLNEKCKNGGVEPYYCHIDSELWEEMKGPLERSLTLFYEEMLSSVEGS